MDKKNTLFLTVIAIATLLVAVVGATFAYFTAQTGKGAQAQMSVQTFTSDSMTYSSFDPLILVANQQNFASGLGSQRAKTSGTITLQSSNMDRDEQPEYCYKSTINITTNTFEYKPSVEGVEETNQPELILNIKKNSQEYQIAISDLTYQTVTGTEEDNKMLICEQKNGVITSEGPCTIKEVVSGYDITTYGKSSTMPEEPGTTAIRIPVVEDDNSNLIHKIKADSKGETKTDTWEASLTFVNYNFDQEYNTNKSFVATWEFTPVDCSSGDPLKAAQP